MINLRSDNESKVFPEIMEYLTSINDINGPAYGEDEITTKAKTLINNFFEKEVQVYFLLSGTAANSIALSVITPPFGGIFCTDNAHINLDECGAPEFFTGGAKLIPIKTKDALISSKILQKYINKSGYHGVHEVLPSAISLTQVSELGTTYSLKQIKDISKLAIKNDLKIHMDGARFANACAFLKCSPAELTWKSGIDILTLGASKNGALSCELLIVFNEKLFNNIDRRQKRAGQLLSKHKFISAQIIKWIEDDRWINAANNANNFAKKISEILKKSKKAKVIYPVQGNIIFIEIEKHLEHKLKKYVNFYNWPSKRNIIRFVIPWDFTKNKFETLKDTIKNIL